jgi:hypothetical protein
LQKKPLPSPLPPPAVDKPNADPVRYDLGQPKKDNGNSEKWPSLEELLMDPDFESCW